MSQIINLPSFNWQFIVSSASASNPLYISPVFISTVTICPSPSCNNFIGTPEPLNQNEIKFES